MPSLKPTVHTSCASNFKLQSILDQEWIAFNFRYRIIHDLGQAKQLNSDFERYLYPSHGFMLEIKQGLITCTAAAMNNPGQAC